MTPETSTPTVVGIHVAPAARLAMRSVPDVVAEAGRGLVGDRYHGTRHRHVSVQSATALAEASSVLGSPVSADATRRNLTISHGEVPTAPGTRLRVGPVVLEVVRVAAPCRLLDDAIGDGARHALRRRAGSICRVIVGGRIHQGDRVELDGGIAGRRSDSWRR